MDNRFFFDGLSFEYENKTELEKTSDGKAWIVNGKICNIEDLIEEKIESRPGGVAVYIDSKGQLVYVLYEAVPAFDSFDRIYDTSRYLLITVNDGYLTGIYLTMGYQYGSVCRYENMRFEDDKTREKMNAANIYDNMKHDGAYNVPKY